MPGRIVDLSDPSVVIPDRIAFDANVLVTRFITPKQITVDYAARRKRVRSFLTAMRTQRALGFVTPTVFQEFLHVAIKAKYSKDLATHASAIGGRKSWELLFKTRPDLLTGYVRSLRRLPILMTLADIAIAQPENLSLPIDGRRFEAALLDAVRRYQLDLNDAAILLEMRRAGLDAIVTEDPDLRRAATDFDVYTWL
jgi:predicted nucleic acid-binding protein